MSSRVACSFSFCLRRESRLINYAAPLKGMSDVKATYDLEDDLELSPVCHRPEGLEILQEQTKFNRKELQILYRGFKNECPNGIVNEDSFKDIYSQFFPQGDASTYAHHLFNAFDVDQDGCVSFEVGETRGARRDELTGAETRLCDWPVRASARLRDGQAEVGLQLVRHQQRWLCHQGGNVGHHEVNLRHDGQVHVPGSEPRRAKGPRGQVFRENGQKQGWRCNNRRVY
ncbi:uncharacterized protein LOC144717564 isoform X2 [Lampetra planeri]